LFILFYTAAQGPAVFMGCCNFIYSFCGFFLGRIVGPLVRWQSIMSKLSIHERKLQGVSVSCFCKRLSFYFYLFFLPECRKC